MEQLIISLILSAISAALFTLSSLKMLQIYQLSSYRAKGFFVWLFKSGAEYFVRYFVLAFFQFISILIFCFSFDSYLRYIAVILFVILGGYFVFLQFKQKKTQKTPLRFTKRIIRQLIILSLLFAFIAFLSVYFTLYTMIGYSLLALLSLLIPFVVTISHFIAVPLETLINYHFKQKAKKALKGSIIKIGITGSYGKTTAKNILYCLLSQKYKVLKSPLSHNTPMGLCKLINSGIDSYEVLIAEMGARYSGDILELCDLIKPNYGIITVTGPQHLETFGSIDEVVKTKLDLSKNTDKAIVINSDDTRLMEGATKIIKSEQSISGCKFLYSGASGIDASFKNVSLSNQGTSFTLSIGSQSVLITTELLGRHIPSVFTECALLAHHLGVSLAQIAIAAAELKPIEHRLQLIKSANATIIDDAYNSNPQGAKNALEVLSMFDTVRVVITPGFVEMGILQKSENKNLGTIAADCTDYLISVKNQDITLGALDAGMDKNKIFCEDSLANAMERLKTLALVNPTILFLNDLPDNY